VIVVKKRKQRRIKVCPLCGSTKLRKISPFSGWLTPEIWVCPDCGYKGPIYAEVDIEQLPEDSKSSESE